MLFRSGFLMWDSLPASDAPNRIRQARLLLAGTAGELLPRQGQLNQSLPIGALGFRGQLHCGLSFVLWIVLSTHETEIRRPIWTSAWQFPPYDCGVPSSSPKPHTPKPQTSKPHSMHL